MNTGSKNLLILAASFVSFSLMFGCSRPVKVLPPEIVEVPKYMPLPAECGAMESVVLPPGSSPRAVMDALNAAVKAYNDKIARCFDASKTP